MLNRFIEYVCNILNITVPIISYDVANFPTETMQAYYDSRTETMFLRKFTSLNPDVLFAVAHELRHIWQLKTNENIYFSNYTSIKNGMSLENYNLQIAEIDAHAFAALLMMENFGIKPLFNGLPNNVLREINYRINYLQKTEFKKGFPKL